MKKTAEVERLQKIVFSLFLKSRKCHDITIEQFFKRPLKFVNMNEYWELLEKAVKIRRDKWK